MSTVIPPAPQAPEVSAEELFEAERMSVEAHPLRRATGTYRLQLHGGFRLEDAEKVVVYLDKLGVSDLYLSPYLAARKGSTHGYDVIDHGLINPEVGDDAAHDRFRASLTERGLGRVLDIVPNHMGSGPTNPFMMDVLENGPQARWARFFDIDWDPVNESLEGRLLLPILEDLYGKVLEAGLLTLERDGGGFWIRYHDRRLPLRPRSYAMVLGRRPDVFHDQFKPDDEDTLEYLSIREAAGRLPGCRFCRSDEVDLIRREKEVIKRRLARLCERNPLVREFVDENVKSFVGREGDPHSFDGLHELLEDQVYRLAYWRVASEEINYRRFFDVTDLAGIRVEESEVFEYAHRLIFRWVSQGDVTALRVDHPDGLADPLGYFRRVQEHLFLQACRARLEAGGHAEDWDQLVPGLANRYRDAVSAEPNGALARRFPIVAEKILSTGEKLPAEWPIDGTVGYEFLNALNGLFVDPDSSTAIDTAYREFTGDHDSYAEALHESKLYVERNLLASELNTLASQLSKVASAGRHSRDFTLNDLQRVLVEVVACFRVYRTYLRSGEPVSARDRDFIDQAVARARRREPTVDSSVYSFVRDVLSLNSPDDLPEADRQAWERFVVRFQQTTGPVQAKGLEDTTFYRQFPLLSLNEVGGDPSRWATSPSTFHALNLQRLTDWPGSLSTSATHDTKRGEDARARIDVISELAEEWKTRLARWSRWNSRKKVTLDGDRQCPDAREEYLLYQTLIGVWPFGPEGEATPPAGLVERVQSYIIKAASEAKRNTTWTDPDSTWKETLSKFVANVLTGSDAAPFVNDFLTFQRHTARVGVVNSLSQTILKLASPGVADVYQGCELWDFSMVDPDNRRPVDYDARARMIQEWDAGIASGRPAAELAAESFAGFESGQVKLHVVRTVLNHRRQNPDLYLRGSYRPVDASGTHKDRVVAFQRGLADRNVVVVAPRLVAPLMGDDGSTPPLGDVWGDTDVAVPDTPSGRWRDLLTGRVIPSVRGADRRALQLSELFVHLPVALLVDDDSADA